jgi:hypothetical protein
VRLPVQSVGTAQGTDQRSHDQTLMANDPADASVVVLGRSFIGG